MNFRFLPRVLSERPNLSMFIAGALAVLALPPLNVFPLIFLSLGWLVLSIAGAQNLRQAFWRGWWWGTGYFVFGWYWISFALRFDWPRFAWLLPLSALALPCAMAIYIGLMGAALHAIARKFQNKKIIVIFLFPVFFTIFELLRGHLFTGFPWNLIGITLTDITPLFQTAAIVGVYGLGFIICASVSAWLIAREFHQHRSAIRSGIIGLWVIMAAFGFWRIEQPQAGARLLNVRIVQPDTAQDGRWDNARRREILDRLTELTAAPGNAPNLVVWPEAAAPYPLAPMMLVRQRIAQSLPPGATLATGSIRRDAGTHKLYNSIEYLNSRGEILGHYDKFHLVPFGEYMPFADIVHIPAVAEIFGDIGRGTGPETQTINGLRISPMICYEAIFPGEVTASANGPAQQPQILLNVTDDIWYGNTTGPYQHLAQARARAVEEGLPLVRAANNGISAAVDRYGRILQSLPYDNVGYLDAQVTLANAPMPPPAAHGMFYAWLGLIALGYLAGGLLLLRKIK